MNEITEKVALVTGATGFTGGHLARALARYRYHVRALVRDPAKANELKQWGIEPVQGDLVNARDVDQAMQGCTHVYHIAAMYRSAKHPDHVYRQVNVQGTRHILDAASRHNVDRVVHCSTAGVHSHVQQIPADETAPLTPGDIYQQTKLEGEMLARHAFETGLPGTIFRPVGIYGPGDLRFLKLFRMIHTGRFRMFGSGKVYYHLTYIDDLVQGIILCGDKPEAIGQTYLLAGPRYTSIAELAQLVAQAVGRKLGRGRLPIWPLKGAAVACEMLCRPLSVEPPLHRRRLDFFLKDRAFCIAKAKRELGYDPRVDLAEGLARTARWYFQQGLLQGPMSEAAQRVNPEAKPSERAQPATARSGAGNDA